MEKVLWLTEHVKSSWWGFTLEISCLMVLHCQANQLKLIAVKSRHWEQSALYHAGNSWHSKISKSGFENYLYQLGYVHSFDAWVPHKWKKPSQCCSLLEHSKNVLFLKQTVTSSEKWILYNQVKWKRLWDESWSTTSQTPVFIQRKWCCVYGGIGKQFSNKSSLWGTNWLILINIVTN